jgi:hypothetical protein
MSLEQHKIQLIAIAILGIDIHRCAIAEGERLRLLIGAIFVSGRVGASQGSSSMSAVNQALPQSQCK